VPLLPCLFSLWRNLVRKTLAEQDLREEVESYLEMLIEMKKDIYRAVLGASGRSIVVVYTSAPIFPGLI
jgi:hypothetical protein